MNSWHHWKLELRVKSPFLFGSLEPGPDGFDSSTLRSPAGLPVIPGDHIRGHVRHAMRDLLGIESSDFGRFFGKKSDNRNESGEGIQDVPCPGLLLFSDAVATSDTFLLAQSYEFPRVAIDDTSGTTKSGMLQFIELPIPPEAVVTFTATISYLAEADDVDRVRLLLENALLMVTALGGLKSSGFGELVHSLPKLANVPHESPTFNVSAEDTIIVSFDRPLVIDSRRSAFNALESATVIPGGAIKGALSRVIGGDRALNKALSTMVISHAFPQTSGGSVADQPIPLAFAISGKQHGLVMDDEALVALCANEVPIFAPDWKPNLVSKAREICSRPTSDLIFQSRGHVAINEAGVAENGQLFVTRHVETAGRRWSLTINRNGADFKLFTEILALLKKGLPGIGRTGAIMKVEETRDRNKQPSAQVGNEILLILETPALLTTILNHEDSATTQYENYFKNLLGDNAFEGFKAVAQRRLVGDYLAHRYRPYDANRYVPFEVTNPGAVFAFICKTKEAADKLNEVLVTGLAPTLGHGLLVDAENDWNNCPFMNHNGFGQISNVTHWLSELKVEALP